MSIRDAIEAQGRPLTEADLRMIGKEAEQALREIVGRKRRKAA